MKMSQVLPRALDNVWYEELRGCRVALAHYHFASAIAEFAEERGKFLAGTVRNPALKFYRLDLARCQAQQDSLHRLKERMERMEPHPIVKRLYLAKLDEYLAHVGMMMAAAQVDMGRFAHFARIAYGTPSPTVFQQDLYEIRTKVEEALYSGAPNAVAAAQALLADLPSLTTAESPKSGVESGLLATVRAWVTHEYAALLPPPREGQLETAELSDLFRQALVSVGAGDWQIVIDTVTSRQSISVQSMHQRVRIPISRQVSGAELGRLLVHEVGTHVVRRIRGNLAPLRLLARGLDHYERGEEGIATVYEQGLSGSVSDYDRLASHLAVCLALGLDGKPRDFRDVFEILVRYYSLVGLSKADLSQVSERAREQAWRRCVRVFRGTDYRSPGICFPRDYLYREGNTLIWELLKDDFRWLDRFPIGKYDPANREHVEALRGLGILPAA